MRISIKTGVINGLYAKTSIMKIQEPAYTPNSPEMLPAVPKDMTMNQRTANQSEAKVLDVVRTSQGLRSNELRKSLERRQQSFARDHISFERDLMSLERLRATCQTFPDSQKYVIFLPSEKISTKTFQEGPDRCKTVLKQ
jgi:hypothetical protein